MTINHQSLKNDHSDEGIIINQVSQNRQYPIIDWRQNGIDIPLNVRHFLCPNDERLSNAPDCRRS